MNRRLPLVVILLCTSVLSSCMLPRNHSEVMRGSVRGGDVPLYMTGSMSEFYRAGLILPDVGGYVRAEFDVLDVGADGLISPSTGGKGAGHSRPVAQVAIPSLVSSYDLSRSTCEMRAACPADQDQNAGPLGHANAPPAVIAEAPAALSPVVAPIPKIGPAISPVVAAEPPPAVVEPPAPLVVSSSPIVAPPQIRPPSNARWITNSYFQVVHLQ